MKKELTGQEMLNRCVEYEERKWLFIKEHRDATPEEIEEFCKKLARKLGL